MRAATLLRPSAAPARRAPKELDPVEVGLGTRGSLRSLLAPERIEAHLVRQISIEDGALRAMRPQLGWKPGEEPPFTPTGLERLMHRSGLAAEVAAWKLERGAALLDEAGLAPEVSLVLEVGEPQDAEVVAALVADWCRAARTRRRVTVELPEAAIIDEPGGRPLIAGLRGAGAEVAVHGCSGSRAAIRQLRRAQPAYIRIDEASVMDDEVAAVAFRMTTLVAAAEGWRTVATGVTTGNAVAFARSCGIDRVEGPRRSA